jgi:hypothetical protein
MKKTYYFYSKADSTHEPIDKIEEEDIVEAIKHFSFKKHLPMDKFMDLYGVGELTKPKHD